MAAPAPNFWFWLTVLFGLYGSQGCLAVWTLERQGVTAVTLAVTLAWAVAWAGASVRTWKGAWVGAWAGTWPWAWTLVGLGTVTWILGGFGSMTGALAGSGAGLAQRFRPRHVFWILWGTAAVGLGSGALLGWILPTG